MVAPSLVPYGFVNVGIEAEAFRREGVEILEVAEEGTATEEDLNCLYRPAFYLVDLTLNKKEKLVERFNTVFGLGTMTTGVPSCKGRFGFKGRQGQTI